MLYGRINKASLSGTSCLTKSGLLTAPLSFSEEVFASHWTVWGPSRCRTQSHSQLVHLKIRAPPHTHTHTHTHIYTLHGGVVIICGGELAMDR